MCARRLAAVAERLQHARPLQLKFGQRVGDLDFFSRRDVWLPASERVSIAKDTYRTSLFVLSVPRRFWPTVVVLGARTFPCCLIGWISY